MLAAIARDAIAIGEYRTSVQRCSVCVTDCSARQVSGRSGAGAAGLYTALCAARNGASVTLISGPPLAGSSSWWAQGGLAAAMSAGDSPERHLQDTIAAGRGAVRESAARVLCDEAPHAVEDLTRLGVRFDADREGRLSLGLEGGHSARRIVHAGGAATGRRLVRQLSALVAEDRADRRARGPSRDPADHRRPTRCQGVRLEDGTAIVAGATVLATGGAAALWSRTTNPAGAIGAGLLLAYDAGATLADLELMQFHPTAVAAANGADGFLVTEAVRGEGARLLDPRGRAVRRRARPARRGRQGRAAPDGARPEHRRSTSTCATSTRRCFRTWSARCARPGSTPSASSCRSLRPRTT